MGFNFRTSIIDQRRKGTSDDPYEFIIETFIVKENKVYLSEIPDYFAHVQAENADNNERYYEIFDDSELGALQFRVDYSMGLVEFASSENNKKIRFTYKGTGANFYPADRVWVEVDGAGKVVKTVQDIIEEGNTAIKNLENVNEAVHNAETATQNANNAANSINILESEIRDAENQRVVAEANRIEIFNGIVDTANNTKDGLDASVIEAKNTYNELHPLVGDANIAKNYLDNSISTGDNLKENLDVLINTGYNLKDGLDNNIDVANILNSDLQNNIDIADNKKAELDTSVSVAITTKIELDNSIVEANNLKQDLNEIIENDYEQIINDISDLQNNKADKQYVVELTAEIVNSRKSMEYGQFSSLRARLDHADVEQGILEYQVSSYRQEFNEHKAENVSEKITIIRDTALTGSQIITTTKNKKIKSIFANGASMSTGTKFWSQGFCDENGSGGCTYLLSDGSYSVHDSALLMFSKNMTVDRVYAIVTNLGVGEFTINWINVGQGTTGNGRFNFLVTYHGE